MAPGPNERIETMSMSTTDDLPYERTITITLRAKSDLEFDDPLDEAVRLIKEGNLEGFNRNQDSSYAFSMDTFFHEEEGKPL